MALGRRGRGGDSDVEVLERVVGTPVTAEDAPEALGAPERWRPSKAGVIARVIVLAILLGFVLAVPQLLEIHAPAFVLIVATAVVYMLMALSMNVLMGYAGQVSLGHAAFLGFGAFGAGYVLSVMRLPWLFALVVAMLVAMGAAALLGAVALRIRGLYLALVTIAFGLFAQETVFKVRSLTGGGAGQPAPRPTFAQGDIAYVYFGFVLVAIVWLLDSRLTASKAGRAIQALRDDERVAASWGINVTSFKLLAFVISGAIAGLAGAYFASIEQIVSAASITFTLSLTVVLLTVVGGLGSRPGVIQGGILFASLPTLLDQAHQAWGLGKRACASMPPRVIQGVIALVLILAAISIVAGLIKKKQFTPGRVIAAVIGLALVGSAGGGLAWATVTQNWCLFSQITALWEPFIGALLLVLTLIFFPGGIAQQQAHTIRWLSFKQLHEPDHVAVGGGAGGGSVGARP